MFWLKTTLLPPDNQTVQDPANWIRDDTLFKLLLAGWSKGCMQLGCLLPSSQAGVSAHGFGDPGKPAWAEHFSRGGGMTLSANHSSCLVFASAFGRLLMIFMRVWKADPHSWNRKGCWEAVNQSCCLFREQLYPNKESSVILVTPVPKSVQPRPICQGLCNRALRPLACNDAWYGLDRSWVQHKMSRMETHKLRPTQIASWLPLQL